MPGSSGQNNSGVYSGNNGQRIFDRTNTDIDESTYDISCRSGSCQVVLEEAIWSSWVVRVNHNLASGGRLNDTTEVDSDFYDGDHKLYVIATTDNTSVEVSFKSTDR